MNNVRKIILEILNEVLINKGYANLIMRRKLNTLDASNRKFASACIYGTLRNYQLCYQWAKPFIHKKCNKKVEIAIVCSIYQLKYMNCKDYVVVNEMVNCIDKPYRQFVNAILHKVIEENEIDYSGYSDMEKLSIQYSLPLWIIQMWMKQYGNDIANQLIQKSHGEAKVFARMNTLVNCDTLKQDKRVTFLNEESFIFDGNLLESSYYHLGQAIIQDIASCQIVKQFDFNRINKILDCCAAPGSKTSQIACYMQNKGSIDACELYPHRAQLLNETLQRAHITNANVLCGDLLQQSLDNDSYDAILLDAPCSGLGVLSRRVEIRHFISGETLDQCQITQRQMLDYIAPLLKVDGQLVYSTCTMNKKENELQIQEFIKRHSNYELIKQHNDYDNPYSNDCFYYAYLRRVM